MSCPYCGITDVYGRDCMCSQSQAAEDAYYDQLEADYEKHLEDTMCGSGDCDPSNDQSCACDPCVHDNLDDIPF